MLALDTLGPEVPPTLEPQSHISHCLSHVIPLFLGSNCYLHGTDQRTKDQRSSERESELTKVTQLVSGRPGI